MAVAVIELSQIKKSSLIASNLSFSSLSLLTSVIVAIFDFIVSISAFLLVP